ncbi:glycosyltransferase [Bacillus thuringiensis]|nr:glycosyltransferase [Bacillus thuringiensis]
MKIAYFGLCYYDKIFKPEKRYSQSSIISLMSNPLKINRDENKEEFLHNNHVYSDITKKFMKDIEEISEFNDYLIIDFMEERFDIAQVDNTYATDSWAFQQVYKKALNKEYKKINKDSETFQEKWRESCLLFIKELKKYFKPSQIVLHEAYKVNKYKKDEEFYDFPNLQQIEKENEILKGYYEFFKENYEGIQVISLNRESNYCEFYHNWGCFPHHFHEEYYRGVLKEIEKLEDLENHRYDVSVIITTYNNAEDIEECIESALNQNDCKIQIIVVDDGSSDNTQEIIRNYANRLDNVEYVFLDNACNPSRNRNIGIKLAKGKYITFLDGDDYLSLDACNNMITKGEKEDADIIVGRMMSFTINGTFETGINNPYYKDRNKFIQNIGGYLNSHVKNNSLLYQFKSAAAKLYKRDLIFNTFFDEGLYYGEDFVFSQKAFLKSQRTVFIEDFVYYYRGKLEADTESLTQRKELDKIHQACRAVAKVDSYQKYYRQEIKNPERYMEKIKKYRVQELIQKLNDFDHFLEVESQENLIAALKDMKGSYLKEVKKDDIQILYIYNYVSMALLLENKYKELIHFRKILLDLKKYQNDYSTIQMKLKNEKLILKFLSENSNVDVDIDYYLQNAKHINRLIDFSFENGELVLKGIAYFNNINILNRNQIRHTLILKHRNSNKEIYIESIPRDEAKFNSPKHQYTAGGYIFKVDFKEISDLGRYDLFLKTTCYGISKTSKLIGYTRGFKLKCKNQYFKWENNNYELIISLKSVFAVRLNKLSNWKYSAKRLKTNLGLKKSTIREVLNNKGITREKKLKLMLATLTEELSGYFFNNKEIWLIGEKTGDTCNDNGYAFFKYCRENYPDKKIYYVIQKEARDYQKVKKLGNVIDFYSLKHLYYSMNAKSILSTDNVNIILPSNIRPLRKAQRVFIQHGIINFKRVENVYHNKNDIADKFLVASKVEKEIIGKHYGFNPGDILPTGLLRTQYLQNKVEEHNILLTFTWRNHIKTAEHFLKSNYYKRIESLINNKSLNQLLENNNVKLNVLLHPRMVEYADLFEVNNANVKFLKFNEIDVKNVIESSSMIITDYSSILFDFVYLKKPIIMYGFDYFNGNQTLTYKQIENLLPGTFFLDEDQVIHSIENHCKMDFKVSKTTEKKYKKMINLKPNSCENLFTVLNDKNK